MLTALHSLWTWFALGSLILIWRPLLWVIYQFDRAPYMRTGFWFRRLGSLMTRVNPAWKVKLIDVHNADPQQTYVVVGNHLSNADIPVISRLRWEMKWVAKAELFTLPIVGPMMRMAGDIKVDRSSKRSRAQVLFTAKDLLDQGCSVMLFPEGTRSRDGRTLPFTDGAFRIAIKSQVPILPLVVDGTQNALPKNTWKFGHADNIRLKVLPPIATTGLKGADAQPLRDQVRTQIMQQLAEWRGVSIAEVDSHLLAPVRQESAKSSTTPAGS